MFKESVFYLCVMFACFGIGVMLAIFEIVSFNFVIAGLLGLGAWVFLSEIYPFIESLERRRKK